MGALVFAALSATAFGVSDFIGGLRARSVHYVWVALVNQLVLTIGVIAWLPFRPGTPSASDLAWGALAAVGHMAGMVMLMRGLSRGAMHVVAPLSAVVGAAFPVVLGLGLGERPSLLATIGIAVAIPAVWQVAAGGQKTAIDHGRRVPAGTLEGVLAGVFYAVFYIGIARADSSSGAWPLVSMEIVSLVLVVSLLAWLRPAGNLKQAAPAWSMGVTALAGTILYFVAVQGALMSLVVVVTSLYPAFTVALAMLVLHERPTRGQVIGLILAAAAVVMIAVGGS